MLTLIGLGSIALLAIGCYQKGKEAGRAESRTLVQALEMEIQRARGTAVLRAAVNAQARRVYPERRG